MSELLDKTRIERVLRAAERALAVRDPEILAGRFSPRLPQEPKGEPARPKRVTARSA